MSTLELTEEEAQAQTPDSRPRTFRGHSLAPYKPGLRELVLKVVRDNDTTNFHDAALLKILQEAHAPTPEDALTKRREIIIATNDVEAFRAAISIELDALSDEEIRAARLLVDEILTPPAETAAVASAPPTKAPAKRTKARRGG